MLKQCRHRLVNRASYSGSLLNCVFQVIDRHCFVRPKDGLARSLRPGDSGIGANGKAGLLAILPMLLRPGQQIAKVFLQLLEILPVEYFKTMIYLDRHNGPNP